MRFVFHTPTGMGYQIHARTRTLALRECVIGHGLQPHPRSA